MRTKALILGAQAPFEGPSISLSEAEVWDVEIKTLPVNIEMNGQVEISIEYPNGISQLLPHGETRIVGALSARARVSSTPGLKIISVNVVEVELISLGLEESGPVSALRR